MIYSGHATVKHVSVLQHQPEITNLILEAARSGFADLIFIHRHPLDSLLTNWVWWRNYLRDGRMIKGTSQVYRSEDELCTALDKNAAEFVEETELHLQSAPLALRLEDLMIDPAREFSKVAEVISSILG